MLSEKHKLSLYKKILQENDQANLSSLLTESRFGIFFDKFCETLRYDVKAFANSSKTPDWLVGINGQSIIAEVYRLNPALEVHSRRDAENRAMEEFRKKNPGVPVMGTFHRIIPQPLKLSGNSGAIAEKAEKYGPLVEAEGYPLIICLYFDFVSGQDKLDLYNCLYGHSVEFGGYVPHPDFPLGTIYHSLEGAMFYDNQQVKNNVSGVLLRTESSYLYFDNPNPQNRLNEANKGWLGAFQVDYNDL